MYNVQVNNVNNINRKKSIGTKLYNMLFVITAVMTLMVRSLRKTVHKVNKKLKRFWKYIVVTFKVIKEEAENAIVNLVTELVFWWRGFKKDPWRQASAVATIVSLLFLLWIVMSWWNVVTSNGVIGEVKEISKFNFFEVLIKTVEWLKETF